MSLTPAQFAGDWSVPERPARGAGWLTRRGFLAAAGLSGVAAAASSLMPRVALGDGGDDQTTVVAPRPIPQTVAPGAPFHIVLPAHGTEPASITDFEGVVGRADLLGTGTGFTSAGAENLLFAADCGFMQGKYVGVDNKVHRGTFLFA